MGSVHEQNQFLQKLHKLVPADILATPSDQPRPLKTCESYAISCFVLVARLVVLQERLDHIVQLLSGYRSAHMPAGLSRADYVRYQAENHLLRLATIPDVVLLLTNQVFILGLPEDQCRFETVMKNDHVRATDLPKFFGDLGRMLQPHKTHRNRIAHRAEPVQDEIADLVPLYFGDSLDFPNHFPGFRKRTTDQAVVKKKRALLQVNADVADKLHPILAVLQAEFESRYDRLDPRRALANAARRELAKLESEQTQASTPVDSKRQGGFGAEGARKGGRRRKKGTDQGKLDEEGQ